MVASLQYRVDIRAYSDFLSRVLQGDNVTGIVSTQFSTIDRNSVAIGYVRHDHYCVDNAKVVYCSWNLTSTLWGQGVMRFALTELFNAWMHDSDTQHVYADYFRRNERCRRLLNRLGFVTQEIPISERLSTAVQQKCLQWVIRRRLDAQIWNASVRSPINNPMDRSGGSAAS